MKKIAITALGMGLSIAFAQGQSFVPNVIPPSPNAAALGKYVDQPVSLYTGLPSIGVPIYELQSNVATGPISLSYHAAGNKVGDIASWVGLGWSLNAGGVITRSVKGLPDEDVSQGFWANRTKYAAYGTNPNKFNFSAVPNATTWQSDIVQLAEGATDFEQDVFMVNALGRSYKLLFKADGKIVTIPQSDVKITLKNDFGNIWQWEIVLEDGTILNFGEATALVNTKFDYREAVIADGSNIASSWYLRSITKPSSSTESVLFSYIRSNNTYYDSGFSESDAIKVEDQGVNIIHTASQIKAQVRKSSILQLNKISSINTEVIFEQDINLRQDLDSTFALKQIKVMAKGVSVPVEVFRFNYGYSTAPQGGKEYNPQNKASFSKRLKLTSFEKWGNGTSTTPQSWVFEYNPTLLPSRRSFAMDNFGYFNGAITNSSLLPPYYLNINNSVLSSLSKVPIGFFPPNHDFSANKEMDATALKAEILTKVILPTKGYTVYSYEPNVITVNNTKVQNNSSSVNISSASSPVVLTKQITFSTSQKQYAKILIGGTVNQNYLNKFADVVNTIPLVSAVLRNANNEVLWARTFKKGELVNSTTISETKYLNLSTVGNFTLTLSVKNPENVAVALDDFSVYCEVNYQTELPVAPRDEYVGGLRIANISSYDGPDKKIEQNFKYEEPLVLNSISTEDFIENTTEYVLIGPAAGSLSNPISVLDKLSTSTISLILTVGNGISISNEANHYVLKETSFTNVAEQTTVKKFDVFRRNSASLAFLGAIQGGTVGYGKVTMTNGPLTATLGKTVSYFMNVPDSSPSDPKLMPYITPDSRESLRGLLTKQQDFNANSQVVKEIENKYNYITSVSIEVIKAQKKVKYLDCGIAPYGQGCCLSTVGFCDVAYSLFSITSLQVNKVSTVQKIFDLNGQNPVVSASNFYYSNITNPNNGGLYTALVKTASNQSESVTTSNPPDSLFLYRFNRQKEIILKYTFDFTDAMSQQMVAKNMIASPLEEQTQLRKGIGTNPSIIVIQWKRTNFNIFNNLFILPSTVQTKFASSPIPITEVTFNTYDASGNLLSYTERNGITTNLGYFGVADIGKVNLVKSKTIGVGTTLAQTTSIDYYPLIGLKQSTSANGLTTSYQYDNFNRLIAIRDPNNNLVKSYSYNYRNQ